MTDRELLQMALDALELTGVEYLTQKEIEHLDALEIALRARLAQPEPVIQARKEGDLIVVDLPKVPTGGGGIYRDEQSERKPSGSWTSWDNTMCNPLASARMQTQSAWKDGYDSAKAERSMHPAIKKMYEDYFDKHFEETSKKREQWVGLTDEELEFYTEELGHGELGRGVLRAVVDFLKGKNT